MKAPNTTKQITVFVGLVIHKGKLLMVQRHEPEMKEGHLKWEIPGGKVDFGETPEEAIRREIKEETGVEVKVKRLLPVVHANNWEYPWGVQQTLLFAYECEFVSQTVKKEDHHVEEVEWVKLTDVKKLDRLPGVDFFLDALRS